MNKYFDSPVILVNSAFSEDLTAGFLAKMSELEEEKEEKVTIIINSPGGQIDALKTLIDAIQCSPLHVTTVASGLAASCGLLLLMAGDHRASFRSANLMSHMYSSGSRGKYHELKASRIIQDDTHRFMIEHYKLYTGLSEAVILKDLLKEDDVWLTPSQALEYGLIDEIIIPDHKPIGQKARKKCEADHAKAKVTWAKQVIDESIK